MTISTESIQGRVRVLIAEDSIADAELATRAIASAGFTVESRRVETAADFRSALDEDWDVIISDHRMPRFDSKTALAITRDRARHVPFLLVSGTIGEAAAVDAMRRGANDYFSKDELERLGPAVAREIDAARTAAGARSLQASLGGLRELMLHSTGRVSLAAVAGMAAKHARVLLAADAAEVFECGAESGTGALLASDGVAALTAGLELGRGVAGRAALHGTPLVVNDYRSWPHAMPQRQASCAAALAVPLIADAEVVGALAVFRTAADRPFSPRDADLLALFAAEVAHRVHSARLQAEAAHEQEVLATAAEAMSDMVYEHDLGKNALASRGALASLFGTGPAPHQGVFTWWLEHVHAADRQRVADEFESLLRDGSSARSSSYRVVHDDGSIRHVLERSSIQRLDGVATRMVGAITDVTALRQAQQAATLSQERFAFLFESVPAAAAIRRSADGRTLAVNAAYEELTGYPRDVLVGRLPSELGLYPELNAADFLERARRSGGIRNEELTLRRADGAERVVLLSIDRLQIDGEDCMLSNLVDVTEARRTARLHKATLGAALDAFAMVDEAGVIREWNAQAEKTFGWSKAEAEGRELMSLIMPPMVRQAHRAGLKSLLAGMQPDVPGQRLELVAIRRDGSVFPLEVTAAEVDAGGERFLTAFMRDVTAATAQREELERLAMYDDLTSLPNRTLLRDRTGLALAAAQRDGSEVGLVMLDIERLKDVNAAHGQAAGDAVLRAVAERLTAALAPGDTAARWGGDEFAIVLSRAGTLRAAHAAAARLRRQILAPIDVDGTMVHVGVTAGLVVGSGSVDAILRDAELALASAQRRGIEIGEFDAADDRASNERLALLSAMVPGLDRGEFELRYQPIVDARTGVCIAAEALVRWHHPVRGLLGPSEFIPALEDSPAISALGAWVLERALRDCASWRGAHNVRVSVNVAMRQLQEPSLPIVLAGLLTDHGLRPDALALEITESGALIEPGPVLSALSVLRRTGVRIAVDDFGSGYASIGLLRRLPLDELKIDRTFVMAATSDHNSLTLVKATVELAHGLGLHVVAEGVEDQRARDLMLGLRCEALQGFGIAKPLTLTELMAWLDRPSDAAETTIAATEEARAQYQRLSRRERHVLVALGSGLSNAQIASELGMSTVTVRSHVQHLLEKLGAHTRLEVVVRATRSGLLDLAAAEQLAA